MNRITLGAVLLLLGVAAVAAQPAPRTPSSSALAAAAAAVAKEDFAAAEPQLRKLVAQGGPAKLAARQLLARVLLAQKREPDAVAELRRAAELGPLERDLATVLAQAEQAAGHPAQAARQLRSVASRFRSAQAWLQLASLQSGERDAAGALASLEEARALAPSSEEVLRAYSEAALRAGKPLAAIPALESLTRLCPGVGAYHHLLGDALARAGDSAAALEPLKEAARLEPARLDTLVALGRTLNERGLYPEAKPHLLRALSLAPDDDAVLAELAVAEEGLGETREAEAHARRVLGRSTANATASLVLGAIAQKGERYAEARDAFQAALAAAPSSPKAHYRLSLVYARLGNETAAARHLATYRRQTREADARLAAVRALTGFATGGMQR